MTNGRKIVLIENQYTQFIILYKYLSDANYVVIPEAKEEYKSFIDRVRIYLNGRYGSTEVGSRRQEQFEKICEVIRDENPSAIIIDYILVGNTDAKDGLDLGESLRKNGGGNLRSMPLVFLSREDIHGERILGRFNALEEPKIWIPKGYSGEEILEQDYFNEHVVEKIARIIEQAAEEQLSVLIRTIGERRMFEKDGRLEEEVNMKLATISNDNVTDSQRRAIVNFYTEYIVNGSFCSEKDRKKFAEELGCNG